MEDISGRSLFKKYDPDISGSPFINDEWIMAMITLSQGNEIGPLKIKLNIENNELYYLDSLGKEMIAVEGIVKKVDCINYYSKDSIRYIFKTGYPAIDKQNENYYYQVLTEGNVELLAKKFKYIRTTKEEVSGAVSKDFVEGIVTMYVYANNAIREFRPNKNFIISVLKNKEQEINKFIDTDRTNFKKTKDVVRLINYYNSLL